MHKSRIALTAAMALLLSQSPVLSLGAETTAHTVTMEESALVSEAWAESVWPSDHWSLPYVRVLVSSQLLSLYEVERLNRMIGPEGLISSASFETYASRTLKTTLPGRVLSSKPITREQLADTLYRMILYSGYEEMPAAEVLDHDQLHWKDADQFSGFGYQASLALRWSGIASGNDGYFNPQRLVTVAEALTTLAKTKATDLRTPLQPAEGCEGAQPEDAVSFEAIFEPASEPIPESGSTEAADGL
ncbi:hypothetical protein [Acidaminobacter hydrogenoformans]|uniref:S-layer homology domain-containing protein n=1 Tax=Acidaminobacter hydrogenoformans DSM 2784 TaxID=1120920 RepID=A0A1G5S3F7_9FIRM|nr:hypothetical protein [Acidaminobacter hydrogenoformans]SCZ80667.1 hypothetical protein SAMN03080599_02387 [Acidaminobacter hydrogenoformans DSM 2784]